MIDRSSDLDHEVSLKEKELKDNELFQNFKTEDTEIAGFAAKKITASNSLLSRPPTHVTYIIVKDDFAYTIESEYPDDAKQQESI